MRLTWMLASSVLLLAACGDRAPTPAGWTRLGAGALGEVQRAQQARGVAAKDEVFGRLTASLQEAFAQGQETVVDQCRIVAPGIAEEAGVTHGVRIGRTSFKLRNPRNTAPAWASDLVADRVETPVWLSHTDGRLAGLLPIHTKAMCLVCHGAPDEIPAPISASLARLYPEDQATGFARGGLRGWFWIEVPAP